MTEAVIRSFVVDIKGYCVSGATNSIRPNLKPWPSAGDSLSIVVRGLTLFVVQFGCMTKYEQIAAVHDHVQIRGRVVGRQEAQGVFSLQVIKSGPSESSTINQSGTFSIDVGGENLLGLAVFNTRRS
jgi:hypothetical protein